MCGAGTVLGKTLIGTADEIQCLFSLGVGAIQHAQGMTAFVAENQALQQKIIGTASGAFAAVHQHPHLAETLSVDQWLMGSLFKIVISGASEQVVYNTGIATV